MISIPEDAFVIIIGAMKSGTSSLYSYLTEHPEICACRKKEPEFFTGNSKVSFPAGSYESLWDFDPGRHRFVLEASTGYTKYPVQTGIPKRIHSYGIHPKFIYVLRDPFERIVSDYKFMLYRRGFDKDGSLVADRLIAFSDYYRQLRQYREFFPKDSFLLLDFEDIKNTPQQVLSSVYSFIGVDSQVFPESYRVHNRSKQLSSGSLFVAGNPALNRLAGLLPKKIMKAGKKLQRVSTKSGNQIKLTDDERREIHTRLEAGMLRLHDEYGFNVEQWGFRPK